MINMTSWLRNQIANLYNAVLALIAVTREALAERLQSVRKSTSLLCNRTKAPVAELSPVKREMLFQAIERKP